MESRLYSFSDLKILVCVCVVLEFFLCCHLKPDRKAQFDVNRTVLVLIHRDVISC